MGLLAALRPVLPQLADPFSRMHWLLGDSRSPFGWCVTQVTTGDADDRGGQGTCWAGLPVTQSTALPDMLPCAAS